MHCPSGNYDTLSSCISEYNQQITFQGHNPQVPNSSIALQLDTALHEHIFPMAYVGKLFHQGKCLSFYTMETTHTGTSLREEYYKSA